MMIEELQGYLAFCLNGLFQMNFGSMTMNKVKFDMVNVF